jgi:hypothetical protein
MELRRVAFAAHGTNARSPTLGLCSEDMGKAGGRGRECALSPVRGQLRKGRPRSCKPNDQRLSLLDMAQVWLMLADLSDHAARTIHNAPQRKTVPS